MKRPAILVVRRDNIGDLVLTLPLIRAIRERFPEGWIGALVNTYNAPILERSPWLDAVYAYEKFKHAGPGAMLAAARLNLDVLLALRGRSIDYAVLAGSGFLRRAARLAWLAGPKHIVGFVPTGQAPGVIDMPVEFGSPEGMHEAEDVFRLGRALGIEGAPPPASLSPDPALVGALRGRLAGAPGPVVGVHISARKPSQRWPVERFIALMRAIREAGPARFALFWSPGAPDDRRHPGDDAKARAILDALGDFPVFACETRRLTELVAGMSLCDRVICSDGGAMHVAAALGKPIVCFFGDSSAERFHPWGVPYVLLQPPSRDVLDVPVAQALAAYERLPRAEPAGRAQPAAGR